MTDRLDRWGEPIEDQEPDPEAEYVPRSREEITAHCDQLRTILRESRPVDPLPEAPTTDATS